MYKVGQVLFVILNKKQQVIPVQVTEQVVRRSLNGEETTYSVSIPGREGLKTVELNQIDGDVFNSIEDVRKQMFEHASQVITSISEKALNVAKNRFKYDENSPSISATADIDDVLSSEFISTPANNDESTSPASTGMKVDLGDGTIANIKMPNIPEI